MYKQLRNSTVVLILLTSFLLSSCGPPPIAQVIAITHDPEFPKDGEPVSFTVNYQNTSQEQALSDVVLEVDYDSYLVYSDSDPQADEVNQDLHKLIWHWPSLQAQEAGQAEIGFMIQPGVPLNVYQLTLSANIQGKTSEGNLSQHSQQTASLLEGHPTPTATPPPVVEEYNYDLGQVTLELPWQRSNVPIHSEQLSFDDYETLKVQPVQGEVKYAVIAPIIHLAVYDEGGNIVNDFDPPIILTVQYELAKLNAETTDQLAILIYDSKSESWIPYLPDFTVSGDLTFASISISSWTSPATWGCRGCPN